MGSLWKGIKTNDNIGSGDHSADNSSTKLVIGGKNIVLKVERDEDFVMSSRVNKCLKYSIFTFSYLLLVFSLGLFTLGFWAQATKSGLLFNLKKFDPKNTVLFFEPTVIIIFTAVIIMTISFCGAVG